MEQVFFFVFSSVAVGTGLLVVVAKNPIHSALALVTCFVQIAALFIMLGSPFLAVIQIFVYVGAVMVLFLFVIMMLDVRKESKTRFLEKGAKPIVVVLAFLAAEMFVLLSQSDRLQTPMSPEEIGGVSVPPSINDLSLTLFSDFLLPFEVASIILLVALVGAVVLARGDTKDDDDKQVGVSK